MLTKSEREEWKAMEELPKPMYEALNAPLPKEAVKQHPTKKYLSTIKVIYMVERLNQVFGLNGWFTRDEFITKEEKHWVNADGEELSARMIVVKVTLEIPAWGITRWAYGGNDNLDLGDAYKGAVTDAISKICGELGIGMDVYKGHGDSPPQAPARKFIPQATPAVPGPAPQPSPNQEKAGDSSVTVRVQSVNTEATRAKKNPKTGEMEGGGKPYLLVNYMEGKQKFSLVCFDTALFDAVKGADGETAIFTVERGGKYPRVVGVFIPDSPPPARTLEVNDGDIPF